VGIWDIFKRPKPRRFVIYLTKRGSKTRLGEIEARDDREFSRKLIELLEQDKELSAQYPRIQIVDLSDGTIKSIKNPFSEVSEAEQPQRSSGSSGAVITIETLKQALELQRSVYNTLMQSIFSGLGDTLKLVVSQAMSMRTGVNPSPSEGGISLKDVADILRGLTVLIQNKEVVADMFSKGLQAMQSMQAQSNIPKEVRKGE